MKRALLLLFLIASLQAFSQSIEIDTNNIALNKLFVQLRDKYKIKFSYNDDLLSNYRVSIKNHFSNPQQAIQSILKDLPLQFVQQNEVFLIFPRKEQKPRKFSISGQIVESATDEPLPFANLTNGDRNITSDQDGNFSFPNCQDSIFHIRAAYLGHYPLDTLVSSGNIYRFKLVSSVIGLKEIVIKGYTPDKSMLIGEEAGKMKFNNQVARFLPGNDDNSVFNLLRLMPGVLASSEQSNGLIIWGSYEGFSQIIFDGFTIWGLKDFSDEINTINPLIIKDMEVLKGGFDASYGDRVGGIVNITGKNGTNSKPSATLNVNNVTMNGIIETPVGHHSSVLFSFRQTYYNQYKDQDLLSPTLEQRLNQYKIDYTIHPNYNFRDANIKFTTKNDKGDLFYISLLGGEDHFQYDLNRILNRNDLSRNQEEHNAQTGATAYYSNLWKNGNVSTLKFTWSGLNTAYTDFQSILKNKLETEKRDDYTSNSIEEYSADFDNWFSLNRANRIEAGMGVIMNETGLIADSSGVRKTSLDEISQRVHAFVQDHISLPGNVEFTLGLRGDYPAKLQKLYLQPRLSASIGLNENVKLNMAWGVYNQFITKSSVEDQSGNYRYLWTSCDNKDVPVLSAEHLVLGSSYKKNNFTFSAEAYYKYTEGLTRFINLNQRIHNTVFQGDGKSYGLDFFMRKDLGPHSAWISYTLSKTMERFPFFPRDEFMRAPQDQRHELKTGFLLDFKPFSFSSNYVFGSGFPLNTGTLLKPVLFEPDYNRLDVAVFYRFNLNKIAGETGFSILNVLNSKNIRYSNFEKVPVDQTNSIRIYSEAVPFSPRISLKISL